MLALLGVGLLPRRQFRSPLLTALRVFFPSWRFFGAPGLEVELRVRTVDAEGTVSAQLSDGTLIFSPANNLGKKSNMSGTVYFFIDDVESYYEMVRDRTDVQWPLQDMSYGTREFGIRDCNGYYLAFAQA